MVYTAPGDGTYNVYQSQQSGNAVDPSLPNQWSATATYSKNQVVQQYPAWNSGTNYSSRWRAVQYSDGLIYASITAGSNINNIPPLSPTFWTVVPALTLTSQNNSPQTSPVLEWNSGTTYSLYSAVMFDGELQVSVIANNIGNNPGTSGQWTILSGGTLYMSLFDLNSNNNPSSAPALWAVGTSYSIGNTVGGSDGIIYTSLTNANLGNNPAGGASPTNWSAGALLPWTTVFTQGGGNQQWLQIGGASFPAGVGLITLDIIYPLGTGPLSSTVSKNVFRLPAGYLRHAPTDPKAGITSWLGVPGNDAARDWTFQGSYIVSWDTTPIHLRFVADVVDVTQFDDMFCEGLAARVGMEVCPTLTQSTEKVQQIAQEYQRWISEARSVNAIEIGATLPPLDDLIACRA